MPDLTITFTESTSTPENGYIVKYRIVGEASYEIVSPNPPGSPVIIPDLVSGQYEGTVQADCGTNQSEEISYSSNVPVPICPDRALVFQICNSNAVKDDNFDIYLNSHYIGAVNLNENAQIGSVFIASLSTPTIISADFDCPLEDMVIYYFDPSFVLGGANTITMTNTQNNANGNAGSVGIRNYLITGTDLSDPCIVSNLSYSGPSGTDFTLPFTYADCCPED